MKKRNYTFEQVKELLECAGDPVYFINNYMKVVHPTRGTIPFHLYDCQHRLVESIHENDLHIAMMGRQSGLSSTHIGYMLWWAIFKSDQVMVIGSHTVSGASEILKTFWDAFQNLPEWMKPNVKTNNVKEKRLDNGTVLQALAVSPYALRGRTINFMYLDNAAYISERKLKSFWESSVPCFMQGGVKLLLSSIPKKPDDWFMKVWKKSIPSKQSSLWKGNWLSDDDEFKFLEIASYYAKWDEIPKDGDANVLRDESFKAEQRLHLTRAEWLRDYECTPIKEVG